MGYRAPEPWDFVSANGIINPNCIAPPLASSVVCDSKFNKTCIDISGHGMCSSKIHPSCYDKDDVDKDVGCNVS